MRKKTKLIIGIITIAILVATSVFFIIINSAVKVSLDNPARKLIERIEAGEPIMLDGEIKADRNGRTISGKMTMVESKIDKRLYMKQVYGVDESKSETVIIYDQDKTTIIMSLTESITLGTRVIDYDEEKKSTEEGVAAVNGRKLPYISYKYKVGTNRYFIDGDKLYALEIKKATSSDRIVLTIDSISFGIQDELFQIPSEYAGYHIVDKR